MKIINLNDKINGNDTKFDIEGSLTKYDRQLRNSIKGEYDVCTKIGYLNIPIKLNNNNDNKDNTDNTNNTNNTKDNNYTNKIPYNFKKNIILIKISGINDNSNNNVFIQIFSMKQHSNLIIPNNQYILRKFYFNISLHSYIIKFIERNNITLELYRNNKAVKIKNLNITNDENDRILKYSLFNVGYKVYSFELDKILNEKYMLKYNYDHEEIGTYEFIHHFNKTITRINNSFLFEYIFENIKISSNNKKDNNISFIIYSYLYSNDNLNETLFNLLYNLFPNSIQPISESKIIVDPKEKNFRISFNNSLKDKEEHNFIIQIKVNVNKNNDYFYNKYLIYSFKEKLEKEINNTNNTKTNANINSNTDININRTIAMIIVIPIIIIIIVIVAVILVLYYKMKKKNINLEEILKTSFQVNKKDEEDDFYI